MRADTILPILDPSNTANRRKNGTHRHKHSLRALFRSAAFLALIAVFLIFNFVSEGPRSSTRRRLQFQDELNPPLLIIVYIIGILYMFLALAIVCDEFFVPALEVMSGSFHLNLSNDIAGATLMAAGGSAPELFTSMIGTFQRSEIGFGTIVGSAVFNVLFVIGMCSICSKELLSLTWWPLARDTSYYAVSLLTLAIFVGVISPGKVELWEAIILFAMYFGYVTVMAFNERLYSMITGKQLNEEKSNDSDETIVFTGDDDFINVPTFRAGFLTLINDPTSWEMKARIGLVSKIFGSADQVFEKIDTDGNGTIDVDEFKSAMKELEGADISDEELSDTFKHIDLDHDQTVRNSFACNLFRIYLRFVSDLSLICFEQVTRKEFIKFYLDTNTKVKQLIEKKFDEFDKDSDNNLDKDEFYELLSIIEPSIDPEGRSTVEGSLFTDGKLIVSREEFSEWYLNSIFYTRRAEFAEHEAEEATLLERLAPPEGAGAFGYAKWLFLLPLVASTTFTIPDVRRHGMQKGKACYFAFFLSIAWIGIYSYFMVGWAELVGDFVGIPAYIMGLTFLAAGTSVPDLLSSVIVARMGEGDMAVSSSIGSNIFDILVGLPLPWIAFSAIEGEVVQVSVCFVSLTFFLFRTKHRLTMSCFESFS
jgi:sodium/potassium/calcium exchanger 2